MTLYEANDYGRTTHAIELDGRYHAVDTGFIVHNPVHYPLLTRLFDELGVASQPTKMSFSVHSEASGLQYNAASLDTLFCQRRNLVSPRFIGLVRDLFRFYREAPALLTSTGPGPTLGDWLAERRYGTAFRDEHLVPMASALWSSPATQIQSFPARHLVQFMANHQMLQAEQRPEWRVVRGGSATYVRAMRRYWQVNEQLTARYVQFSATIAGRRSQVMTVWNALMRWYWPAAAIRHWHCWPMPAKASALSSAQSTSPMT